MLAPILFALALAQADAPPPAASPPAASTPVMPAGAIVPGGVDPSEIPKGAPTDDYGLVAWCRGALTGHMALYPIVQPELKGIEQPKEVADDAKADHLQMQAGRDYLALYRRAMLAAEKAHPRLHPRGVAMATQGEAIWAPVQAAAARTRMWSWLMWDLPGQCETSAKRLQAHPAMLGKASRPASVVPAPSADAPPSDAPAPAPAAGPTDSAAPQPTTAGSGPPQ